LRTSETLEIPLPEEDVLDEPLEGEIGYPQVGADDDAGDQDDCDALDQLLLAGPLDLLELGGGLGDKPADAGARKMGWRSATGSDPATPAIWGWR